MLKRAVLTVVILVATMLNLSAETTIVISDPETWTTSSLSSYVGQTVTFITPLYVTNNYYYSRGQLSVSPRRVFAPTNQAFPRTAEYNSIVSLNQKAEMTLSGLNGYHRMGEKIVRLRAKVTSTTSLTVVGTPQFVGNTRAEMLAGPPSVDLRGKHTLLVCAFNLEYYLVENLGTGYGPDNKTESERQHSKIMDALTHINADIFGFVEIEQGQAALRKIAESLTKATGRPYSYVNDGGSSSSSYTKSGYVYCTETVEPYGAIRDVDSQHRKKTQAFVEKATGEKFIFSLNHFKAKTSSGATGQNADQKDGQGTFNQTRVEEARKVLSQYDADRTYYKDEDILIMGDLNAYAKEDPIREFTDYGMTDLHRYFHADSSYSYVYHNQAGYLDHAIVNSSLLLQVTGMAAYHINSDEHDGFTYDKSQDLTMFRSSDHDPVLVGLSLSANPVQPVACVNNLEILSERKNARILNALGGHYFVHDISGNQLAGGKIDNNDFTIKLNLTSGIYIVTIYHDGQTKAHKIIVP